VTTKAYLRGTSYVLGEAEIGYADIPRLPELAASIGLAQNPGLWGWGTIRVTKRSLPELAAASCSDSLKAAGLAPGDVDALVCCATRVDEPSDDHGSFLAAVLTGAGLGDIACYGQNLNRCLNLVAGLDTAVAFVRSGRYRRVLVVTVDAVAEGADPISQFALYSDGAASCVVCADPGSEQGCYEILGCATAQDAATMDGASQISSDLAKVVNERLLSEADLKLPDIAALLHLNLFKPVLVMKELQAGFATGQLYLDNIVRLGHCFSADPLINLSDRQGLGHIGTGQHCLLAASVPGARAGILLKRER
jgi:3-oxoacyl-[acyl-carrier-protein] synthase-3